MKVTVADSKKDQKRFLRFRKKIYKEMNLYIDNSAFMLEEIFGGKLHFVKEMEILPVMVEAEASDEYDTVDGICCEAVIAYTKDLPEYIQLCFFECVERAGESVSVLTEYAMKLGKERGCKQLVVGLYGHVNYGLGLLDSHFDSVNSFSSAGNPQYYNTFFRQQGFDEIKLNTYFTHTMDDRLSRYAAVIKKLNRTYIYRPFDVKQFDRDAKIYTDLNNACFSDHRYYYRREYIDDKEMLKELFYFMKGDSIIYAYKDETPVGFIMWYPDFNELAKPGECFGTKHYFRNLVRGKKIQTAKVMEYGVLPEYRNSGLPMGLMKVAQDIMRDKGLTKVETSWILAENIDSNSFCEACCDERYKDYVVYEKEI